MTDRRGILFVPYRDTLELLRIDDAMQVCEDVYRMHARGSVVLSAPPSFKLDVADGFNNHWHVKSVFLKELPATGVRLYYDAASRASRYGYSVSGADLVDAYLRSDGWPCKDAESTGVTTRSTPFRSRRAT